MTGRADTIFALASAPGRAGVAVIRVSGPGCEEAIRRLTRREVVSERQAVLRILFDPTSGDRIDEALVLRFCAPRSYTGEDVVEFQVHGGRAVQTALFSALGQMPGLRPAEPGEFTRRAVENGRLDLTQAEAIADLVDAETEAQRRQALRQYDGELSALYENWRSRLIRAAAWIEAGIDFADEEIPGDAMETSRAALAAIARDIRNHLDDGGRGEILREGLHIAVIGPPNAGKSSLVNMLARRDVAIVSEIPGTTRDVIEVKLNWAGYPVILADTAGVRESEDRVEQEGVRRALARAESAHINLVVLDGAAERPLDDFPLSENARHRLFVWNKADLVSQEARLEKSQQTALWLSAITGEGIDKLADLLGKFIEDWLPSGEAPALTRARHRKALEEAETSLSAALAAPEPELAAEHVRIALQAIGRITGRVDLDELLDVVFRDFCIGK